MLVIIGTLKRAEPQIKGLSEESLLMRALRDFNAPKIVQEDEVIMFVTSHSALEIVFFWIDRIIRIRLVKYIIHFTVIYSLNIR